MMSVTRAEFHIRIELRGRLGLEEEEEDVFGLGMVTAILRSAGDGGIDNPWTLKS